MAQDKQKKTLTIRILGRDYSVACPQDERESLLKSAEHLSKRMEQAQRSGRTLGIERIAVLTALNITRDLLDARDALEQQQTGTESTDQGLSDRLSQLQLRIDSALDGSS